MKIENYFPTKILSTFSSLKIILYSIILLTYENNVFEVLLFAICFIDGQQLQAHVAISFLCSAYRGFLKQPTHFFELVACGL